MDWCVAIRQVQACPVALRRHHGEAADELETLLRLISHEDMMVAFAAKEALREVLTSQAPAETPRVNVIQGLLLPCVGTWRREASGFRFLLLRQLIKMKSREDDGQDEGSEEEEKISNCIREERYLHMVLGKLKQVAVVVRSVFGTERHDEGLVEAVSPCSVQFEALVFMSDFIMEIQNIEVAGCYQRELIELMTELMNDVFLTMDYASQPTFVSCAVLGLLGSFLKLMELWRGKSQNDSMNAAYSIWLERCLVWLKQSSCTTAALNLLGDKESLDRASQNAFIAASSRYPFLQQWLLYLTRLGVALLEAASSQTQCATGGELPALDMTDVFHRCTKQIRLPTRRQLFTVLAEQDDVMIEVLNGLTRIADIVRGDGRWPLALAVSVWNEYDPDILFADLVDTLGRDYLVLLDFLTSNETQMLEYLMRYLRHLSNHWSASKKKLQSSERLESVMSVLIRLRMEIDRLVAVDMFPYAAGPLTRKLVAIEQLFEGPDE